MITGTLTVEFFYIEHVSTLGQALASSSQLTQNGYSKAPRTGLFWAQRNPLELKNCSTERLFTLSYVVKFFQFKNFGIQLRSIQLRGPFFLRAYCTQLCYLLNKPFPGGSIGKASRGKPLIGALRVRVPHGEES